MAHPRASTQSQRFAQFKLVLLGMLLLVSLSFYLGPVTNYGVPIRNLGESAVGKVSS